MTPDPTPTDCRAWREASFDDEALLALGPGAVQAAAELGHGATCADCRAWWERQCRLASALRSVARVRAPDELDRRTEPRELSAACARAVLDHLRVLHAPSVLDRLVREEIDGQPGTTVRRFAGDLERHAAPASLDARVRERDFAAGREPGAAASAAPRERRGERAVGAAASPQRGKRAWWVVTSGALAAGLLGIWSYSVLVAPGQRPARSHRFEVVEIDAAQLREQSPFGFGFANGLTGGALLAQAAPARTEAGR